MRVATAPVSMALAASATPVGMSGARSAATRTAAALSRTMLRRGPFSPEKIAVRMAAFGLSVAALEGVERSELRPASSGVMVLSVMMPL